MTYGREICNTLKEIRQQIADKNEIEYIVAECHFEGECKGTCPKCESEVKYIENELYKRTQLGKIVTVAGISLGIAGTFLNCNTPQQQQTNTPISEQKITADTVNLDTIPIIQKDSVKKILQIPIVGFIYGEFDGYEYDTAILNNENYIWMFVETMPEFSGGDEARMKFFMDNIEYPPMVRTLPSGKVVVSIVVEKDGSLTNFSIVRSSGHPILDEEVLRVAKLMPNWIPGKQRDKNVRVRFQIPITFSLD
jgi:TonB family protein